MSTFIVLSEKKWNKDLVSELSSTTKDDWILISSREDFTVENLRKINPEIIFIPHWSYIIPSSIFNSFECIVFHMTDLPYGRGGSPLQNLIVRGHKTTKISALRVEEGLDTGDVYLKQELALDGKAQVIYERANAIISQMIIKIVEEKPLAIKQSGEAVLFKRRTKEMSSIENIEKLDEIYDYIRMLDADGYPNAFLETKFCKFEFKNVSINEDNTLEANVRIIKK